MRKTFLLILVSLFFVAQAQSADQVDFPDIYIDADAGDTGVGSQADPYNEFSDINWTTGGDNSVFDYYAGSETASVTINLQKRDTWYEQLTVGASGSASYPIIIQSYGSGADPIIDGSYDITTSGWSDQGGNVWRHTLSFGYDPHGVFFDDTYGVEDATPDSWGEWYYAGGGNLDVYSEDDPDNGVYYSSIRARARTHGVLISDKSYITVDGLDIKRTRGQLIRVTATTGNIVGITISNNILSYGFDQACLQARADSGYEIQNSSFYGNTMHHCPTGTYPSRNHNCLYYNNIIHTNGRDWDVAGAGGEDYGIGIWGTDDSEFYGNTIYNNQGNGIHLFGKTDPPSRRNKIYNNFVYNNLTDPVYVTNAEYHAEIMVGGWVTATDQCEDSEVYNNMVNSDIIGIRSYGTKILIYNNIIYSSSSTEEGILLAGNEYDTGTKVYGNTIYNFGTGIELTNELGGYAGLSIKNNIISGSTTGVSGSVSDWDYNLMDNTTDYSFSTNAPLISGGTLYSFFADGDGSLASFAGASPAYKITLTDDSLETLVGYIGEADVAEALGTETIDVHNDRDFSSETTPGDPAGNWVALCDGSGTVEFDNTDIGGADDKQMLITSSGDSYCYVRLLTDDITLAANRLHKITANVYIPAANSAYGKEVKVRVLSLEGNSDRISLALEDDTWTVIEAYHYITSDVDGSFLIGFYANPVDEDKLYIDDISIKPVNSTGTDGVVIYTTSGLSTEGWVDSGSNFDWQDTEYDIAFNPAGGSNDVSGDPLFADSGSYDFSLLPGSAAINAGVDLGDSYDDGFNPTSTWPDGVLTIDQDDCGNWDIGAYVWPGTLLPLPPMGFKIIGGCVF